jgi:hypothetical protein
MELSSDLLDQLYLQWRYSGQEIPRWPPKYTKRHYRDQKFEDWLWQQGFTVVQKDKQRYLRFSGDGKQLTFFLLKYGGQ